MSRLIVPREILAQHVAILGKTRSGKSSVMRLLVEDLLERKQPVCIVDPKGDWWGIKLAADGKGPGYPVVIFGGEHGDVPIDEHAGAHIAELVATGNRPCLIDLGGWMVGPRTRFWIDFASTLFKHTKGERWLAVDEFHNFAPKGKIESPEAGKMLHWSNRLASEGLGKGLAMLFASQRPQKVHNDSLTSAETLIAMRVLHPSDRGAVSDWIKGCGDSDGSQVLNSLAQMERGEGWAWSPEIGFGPKRVKFPLFKTYDSFRAQTLSDTRKLKGWAEVDLDEVRQKLAATIEKAKAEDPKELRRLLAEQAKRIRELERQPVPRVQTAAKAIAKRVDVPILKDGQVARLEKGCYALESAADKLDGARAAVAEIAKELVATMRAVRHPAPMAPVVSKPSPRAATSSGIPDPGHVRRSVSRPLPQTRVENRTSPPIEGLPDLKRCERAILSVLAQHGPCEKGKLALLAGYPWNGSFRTALSVLRTARLVSGENSSTMALTEEGGIVAPTDRLPVGSELRQYWLQRFKRCERAILEALFASPEGLNADELAATAGYPWNGSFRTALSVLRTAGVVVGKNSEIMRASEELFD